MSMANSAAESGYGYLAMRARTLASIADLQSGDEDGTAVIIAQSMEKHARQGHVTFLGMEIAANPLLSRRALDAGVGRIDLVTLCSKLFRLPIAASAVATAMPRTREAALAVIEAAEGMDDVSARAAIMTAAKGHPDPAVRRRGRSGTPSTASERAASALGLTRRGDTGPRAMADGQRNPEIAENALPLREDREDPREPDLHQARSAEIAYKPCFSITRSSEGTHREPGTTKLESDEPVQINTTVDRFTDIVRRPSISAQSTA